MRPAESLAVRHCHRQPERRRGEDHDLVEPRPRAGAGRAPHVDHGARRAGEPGALARVAGPGAARHRRGAHRRRAAGGGAHPAPATRSSTCSAWAASIPPPSPASRSLPARGNVIQGLLEQASIPAEFDVVTVDPAPAGLGKVTTRAIEAATHVLASALQATSRWRLPIGGAGSWRSSTASGPRRTRRLILLGVVLSMFDREDGRLARGRRDAVDQVPGRDHHGHRRSPRDETFLEACCAARPCCSWPKRPPPLLPRVFDQLASDVMDRIEPLLRRRREERPMSRSPPPRLILSSGDRDGRVALRGGPRGAARRALPRRAAGVVRARPSARAAHPHLELGAQPSRRRALRRPRCVAARAGVCSRCGPRRRAGRGRRADPAASPLEGRRPGRRSSPGRLDTVASGPPPPPRPQAARPLGKTRRSPARALREDHASGSSSARRRLRDCLHRRRGGPAHRGRLRRGRGQARRDRRRGLGRGVHLAAAIPGNSSALFELHVGEGPFFQLIGFEAAMSSYVVGSPSPHAPRLPPGARSSPRLPARSGRGQRLQRQRRSDPGSEG